MTRWIDNSIADRLYILDHIFPERHHPGISRKGLVGDNLKCFITT